MSIHRKSEKVYEVRWREGGRNKSLRVHGSFELARKIERKKMGARDENRHPEFPLSRLPPHVCVLVHDERRRSLRTREDLGPLEYQDTERYAKLARHHIARTGNTAREIWKLMEQEPATKRTSSNDARVLYARMKTDVSGDC